MKSGRIKNEDFPIESTLEESAMGLSTLASGINFGARPHFNDGIHYRARKLHSYNCRLMGIIGARGYGKTFLLKGISLNEALFKNKKFIWLRDTEAAAEEVTADDGYKFFSDISPFYPAHEFDIKGEVIRCDKKTIGYCLPMSTYYKYKGNAFADCSLINLDEFIPETQQYSGYDRAKALVNTLETVGRLRTDYKVYMTGNSLNRQSDILALLGMDIKDYGYYVNREKDCVIHYAKSSAAYHEAHSNSLVGKLVKNTVYENSIITNLFNDDLSLIVPSRPPHCIMLMVLYNEGDSVRIYHSKDTGLYYAWPDTNTEQFKDVRFTHTPINVDSRCQLIPKPYKAIIINANAKNLIRYKNLSYRNIINNYIKKS